MANTKEFDVAAYATAYVAANKVAQKQDTTKPDFKSAYDIADVFGHDRETVEWRAAVDGAAAFYVRGDRF